MHYTSVPNILKVLNPLFLDELREQLEDAGDNGRKLLNLKRFLEYGYLIQHVDQVPGNLL